MLRTLGALIGDVLAILLFVAIGLIQHGIPLEQDYLLIVGWPFAAGLLVGHLAAQSWRKPFGLWPQGVFIWAITIVAAMAIRTLFQMGTEPSFVIVTSLFLGIAMLGWRAVATYLTRGERVEVIADASASAASEDDEADADENEDDGEDTSHPGAPSDDNTKR